MATIIHFPTDESGRRRLDSPHDLTRRFVIMTLVTIVTIAGLVLFETERAGAVTADEPDRVSVGHRFACAIDVTGQVSCWGWSTVGQLGNGIAEGHGGTAYPTPQPVPGVFDAVSVAAGYQHACALLADGRVLCWGAGLNGQLGDGADLDSFEPVQVVGLNDAVALSVSDDSSCALRRTGAVVCWGDNAYGQMGDGTEEDSIRPSTVSGLTDAVSIDMTDNTGCAARRTGQVACWGYNAFDQIDSSLPYDVRTPVTLPDFSNAVDVVSSTSHGVCALLADGYVHCLNDGDPFHSPNVASISANDELCVIGTNGAVVCNEFVNGVSVGDFVDMNLTPSVEVEVGLDSACAVFADGSLVCWGNNRWGQLGTGSTAAVAGPVTVTSLFIGASEVPGPTVASASTLRELTLAGDFRPEHADVLRLYRAFFDREPDLGGAKYWISRDLGGAKYWISRYDAGMTLHDITRHFAGSVEFADTYGQIDARQYVYLVYQNVLDREPDAGGYAYWVGRMQDGSVDTATLMLHFSLSPEFRGNHPYPA